MALFCSRSLGDDTLFWEKEVSKLQKWTIKCDVMWHGLLSVSKSSKKERSLWSGVSTQTNLAGKYSHCP